MTIRTMALAAGLLAAAVAVAQPGPGGPRGPGGPGPMIGSDTNGDGLISRAEAQAQFDERFARLDTNGDDAISTDELRAAAAERREERRDRMAAMAAERFDTVDTDGDGSLSLAEMQAARPNVTQEQFEAMDENDDGLVSPDERPRRGSFLPEGARPLRPGAFSPGPGPR